MIFKHQSLIQCAAEQFLLGFGPTEVLRSSIVCAQLNCFFQEELFVLEYLPIAIVHPRVKAILIEDPAPQQIEVQIYPR